MLGSIDPRKMQAMMKQMGIKQEEILAERVVIEKADSKIVIEPAQVQRIVMQGQTSFQIAGEVREETKAEGMKEEDINLVAEKTGASLEDARKALEEAKGDIAEAIMNLGE
jgi:nascent polypeptide-associated complex subunit alpha